MESTKIKKQSALLPSSERRESVGKHRRRSPGDGGAKFLCVGADGARTWRSPVALHRWSHRSYELEREDLFRSAARTIFGEPSRLFSAPNHRRFGQRREALCWWSIAVG